MTGYGDDWGSWKPHPWLTKEWNEFSKLSSQGPHNSDISNLCIHIPSVPDELGQPDGDKSETSADKQQSESLPPRTEEEHFSPPSQPLTQFKSQEFPYLTQTTEGHDVDSFFMELHEVLESHNIPLSDDLVSLLSDLPLQAFPQLLQRLQEELTSEGLQTLCELACEDIQGSLQQNNWLHPALICKFILLPKATSEGECANEFCQVLEEFAQSCPKIVIVQVLQPLLIGEMNVQSDLVQRVTSALPVEHHLHVIKFVLEHCATPLPLPKINILMAVLKATTTDLTAVFKKLMNLLEQSGDPLADNEQFSDLLLIIIRRQPPNTPQSLRDLLANIVRQNKSFNKQILLNALKETA